METHSLLNTTKKPETSSGNNSENSDSDSDFYCEICNKFFSGLKPLKQHQKSGKHLKTLRRNELKKNIEADLNDCDNTYEDTTELTEKIHASCEICEKDFTSPESYKQHLECKKHKKKFAWFQLLNKAKVGGSIDVEKLKNLVKQESPTALQTEASIVDEKEAWKCTDCDKIFSGIEPFTIHLNSKVHKKKIKQKDMKQKLESHNSIDVSRIESVDENLICRLCQLCFTGPENAFAHLRSKKHSKLLELKEWKKKQKKVKNETENAGKEFENNEIEISLAQKESKCNAANPEKTNENVENKDAKNFSLELEENKNITVQKYESYKNYKKIMEDSQFEY